MYLSLFAYLLSICFAPSLVGVSLGVLEKKIYKFRYVISFYLPFGKGCDRSRIPITQKYFVPSLVEIGLMVLEKILFLILSVYFRYFLINSHWKRALPFIWTKLILLYRTALCPIWFKLVRRRLLRYVKVFQLLHYYLPLENCGHSFEQTYIPFTQGC